MQTKSYHEGETGPQGRQWEGMGGGSYPQAKDRNLHSLLSQPLWRASPATRSRIESARLAGARDQMDANNGP